MGPLNIFDALKVPDMMPLLQRGVAALERLADAQEEANLLSRLDQHPPEPREAPTDRSWLQFDNGKGEKKPPPEGWGTTERVSSV